MSPIRMVAPVLIDLFATTFLDPCVARGTNPTSARRGLGELVRAGVVKPVLQVMSAAEERLKLLVMDRRLLDLCVETVSAASSSELF